ncbi:hypothetical protein HNY73_019993 [Argiope bruennichi]|uniref:Uncharacterized protein n=1 Tax=Argiope bruennichi TaxID=94029 RepID=A0A8T0E574_ARGBR|nr:hypothetical protein HNY73_019993 [Argiope bruennichi]
MEEIGRFRKSTEDHPRISEGTASPADVVIAERWKCTACMMKAGWPMKGKAADCPEPEEEEEIEEDWPDYYEEEMMEDQYAWDTKAVPVYKLPDDKKKSKMQKKGDDLDEKKMKDVIVWVKVKDSEIVGPRNKFDYDFDYISL